MVGDTSKVTILLTHKKLHAYALSTSSDRFQIAIKFKFFREFRRILHIWEATTAKQMKTDPNCQRQRCNTLNVFFQHYVSCVDLLYRFIR